MSRLIKLSKFLGKEKSKQSVEDNLMAIDKDLERLFVSFNNFLYINSLQVGSSNNNLAISSSGDVTFSGTAGFYPRRIAQSTIPANGTGATQIDENELVIWNDLDASKAYIVFNDASEGVLSVEIT